MTPPPGALRWLVTFTASPLGARALLLVGPVDDVVAAVLGGAVTGLVLGAVQSWALRLGRTAATRWTLGTAAGLAAGLALGAGVVGFGTSLGDLVVQGAVSGLAVGAVQAALAQPVVGRRALAWPPLLAALWALGWAVTTLVGVGVEDQFTVFGSTGALVVTALTALVVVRVDRPVPVAAS